MASNSLGYEFLSPSQPLGILILVVGAIFTSMIILIFINASQDKESSMDRKRKKLAKDEQSKKIARLYPKKKQN
ncbi:hypothetical protein EV11_0850 [Prochlorococcus sp. SS52]|uniref:Uncharacterized protein n=1 Tax=Prochlorococcus marinus (strain SARG / CCMP1375 / SS120) TaxID=167539 RepID=Q7VCT9_PROMA|nr:hypothetical protein [Prochlorococcus marinus]AAP99695.1 Predicted protein [Prochlorococcus marinus subsp. marinus str. CCMP1375]KGG21346.1 hypothetical protein EV08_0754 [Prochlorococcus marinus str. SS2]KGG36478.1 hypothetical protein EV11_0850 [Prochlorococcus sp. SS52]KGG13410.1 hypothetical protein EV04_0645 [Prochlorococcus marinus str. LG]KGG24322.1 hypothetical protein EV09_0369 [Prochlorococcus marinus str. SS35]